MFKVGDKVIVVNAESVGGYYENGDIGVVSKIDSKLHGYVTRNDGVEMNVYWREVELYKQPVVFQTGDRVKFIESSLASGMIDAKEDDVFTVKESYKRAVTLEELQGCYHVTHFEHVQEKVMDNTEEQEIEWEGSQIDWQVGQEVWDASFGQGVVIHVFDTQIQVKFGNSQSWKIVWYTPEGIYQTLQCAKNRTLFFSEPKIEAEKFPPKKSFVPVFKKGDRVVVTNIYNGYQWIDIVEEENEDCVATEKEPAWLVKSAHKFYKIGEEITFN